MSISRSVRFVFPLLVVAAIASMAPGPSTRVEAAILDYNHEFVCPDGGVSSDNGNYRLGCTVASSWQTLTLSGTFWDALVDGYYGGYGTHVNQWSNPGSGAKAEMQIDGNFVLYNSSLSAASWETNTDGWYFSYLNVQNDGNLVIYQGTTPRWSLF